MRALLRGAAVAALVGCASTAAPGGAPASPAPPGGGARDSTVDRTIPETSPALAVFDVPAGELPPGLTVGPGEPVCASVQPVTFYAQPGTFGLVPKPRARRALGMRRGGRLVGSVLLFEYGEGQIPVVRQFLDSLLWGEERAPTAEHPEQIAVAGNVLAILCLDERDDAAAWYTDRLRARHGARLPRKCPALDAVAREAAQAGNDKAATLAAVHRHEQELLACSTGALFVGELARGEHDLPRAEAAFRRAIALDAQGDVLLFSDGLYAAHDGLALAVAMQGRAAESLPLFQQSLAVAKATGDRKLIGSGEFNLACAYAELGRAADASEALQRAVAIDARYKQTAQGDESIRKVLGAPELRWLSQ